MGWFPNRLSAAWPGFRSMCQLVGLLPWRGSKVVRPLIDPELCMPATDPRLSSSPSVRAGWGLSFVLNGGVPSACREGFAVTAGGWRWRPETSVS
jgi:hypothetical protein